MIATVDAATILGARGHPVTVEVHISKGVPAFTMLGLPDESCREARDRVRAAIMSSGLPWPEKKITVNLAPPHYRKAGSGLDVAIAIGILLASEILPPDTVHGLAFAGELGLDGSIRRVPGVAPMVGVRPDHDWVVPTSAADEARAVGRGIIRSAERLSQLVGALTGAEAWPELEDSSSAFVEPDVSDLADVKGQPLARLALEVAAAGGHHLLFVGPPGSGKTMLAKRLSGLLPDLDPDMALQATMAHSAAGVPLPSGGLLRRPPFRAPHHTSSIGSIVGGGSHQMRPGEISLAHGGVLFLDELGQFAPMVLDGLREALEEGRVMVGRVEHERVAMPARFQLIAATNPCPCGGAGPLAECACTDHARARYTQKLSGPLLDRFDLRVSVHRPNVGELLDAGPGEPTLSVAARVLRARSAARERTGSLNCALDEFDLNEFAPLDAEADQLIRREIERGRLTGRGYHRVRRVARTIADLRGDSDAVIGERDITSALSMRASIGLSAVGAAV